VKTLEIRVMPSTERTVWHVLAGEKFVVASFEHGADPYLGSIRFARGLAGTLAPFCDVDVVVQETAGAGLTSKGGK